MSESKSQCVNAFCSPIHNLTTFQSRHKTPPTNSDGKREKKGKRNKLTCMDMGRLSQWLSNQTDVFYI